jgi:hypothetical protein
MRGQAVVAERQIEATGYKTLEIYKSVAMNHVERRASLSTEVVRDEARFVD